jgi:hypothetical protein
LEFELAHLSSVHSVGQWLGLGLEFELAHLSSVHSVGQWLGLGLEFELAHLSSVHSVGADLVRARVRVRVHPPEDHALGVCLRAAAAEDVQKRRATGEKKTGK